MVAGPWRPGVSVATPVGQRSWGLVWCRLGWVGLVRGSGCSGGVGAAWGFKCLLQPLSEGGTKPRLLADSFAGSWGWYRGMGSFRFPGRGSRGFWIGLS